MVFLHTPVWLDSIRHPLEILTESSYFCPDFDAPQKLRQKETALRRPTPRFEHLNDKSYYNPPCDLAHETGRMSQGSMKCEGFLDDSKSYIRWWRSEPRTPTSNITDVRSQLLMGSVRRCSEKHQGMLEYLDVARNLPLGEN